MNIEFAPLFTLAVTHAFYGGPCHGIRFVVPADARQLLDGNRMRARSQGGTFQLFYEKNADSEYPAGLTIRVGIVCSAPGFATVTDLPFTPGFGLNIYRNSGSSLAAPLLVFPGNRLLTHSLRVTNRPTTATLTGPTGETMALHTVNASPPDEVSFDLNGYPAGLFRVTEAAAGASRQTDYYCDPELRSEPLFAVAEITISDSFYTTDPAPTLVLALAARSEPLSYYVVADGYLETDPLPLLVTDEGAAEQKRDKITFAPAAGDAELLKSLKQGKNTVIKVFRSAGDVPRTAAGRRKIQLKRNGETLIANLPQPGAGSADSNVIVHITKG